MRQLLTMVTSLLGASRAHEGNGKRCAKTSSKVWYSCNALGLHDAKMTEMALGLQARNAYVCVISKTWRVDQKIEEKVVQVGAHGWRFVGFGCALPSERSPLRRRTCSSSLRIFLIGKVISFFLFLWLIFSDIFLL